MKNYYALCSWRLENGKILERILFKLKKDLPKELDYISKELLTNDEFKFDIFPFIDSIFINNAPSVKINLDERNWKWVKRKYGTIPFSDIPLSKKYNDRILEFDSDDDAKLWFEMEYNF